MELSTHVLCALLQVRLTTENIETILNTLLYDGQAEVTLVASGGTRSGEESEEEGEDVQRLYCATKQLLKDTGFSRVPCGLCPVSLRCAIERCCDIEEGGRERERERERERVTFFDFQLAWLNDAL